MSLKHSGSVFSCCCKTSPSPPEKRKSASPSKENLVDQPKKSSDPNLPAQPVSNPAFSDPKSQKSSSGASSRGVANNNTVVNPDQVKLEPAKQAAGPPVFSSPDQQISRRAMAELAALVSRLEAVTSRLENVAGGGGGGSGGAPSEELAPFVLAYDEVLNGPFAQFVSLSNQIGGDVQTQVAMVKAGFDAQREFLVKASKCKQPAQTELPGVLKAQADQIQAVQEFREKNRGSPFFNHLSALSESIPALGWVAIAPAPGPYVKEMSDAGMFYTNRVLKDYKEKDKAHADWVKAWIQTLSGVQAYIKQHHTTGVSWNRQGVDISQVGSSAPAPPPPAAGGPPPPPPPGPPPPVMDLTSAPAPADESAAARNALFADLNKGTDITKGLKKVGDDQKTHKNPNLRLQGPQPFKAASANSSPKPFKSFTPGGAANKPAVVKPPKCELEGKKWIVEYQQGNRNIVLDDVNMKQTVYIFRCTESTIQVKGKVNSITLDGCKKSAVVFDDAISAVEFINCQSVQAQVTGKVPTVSIDKTDGCQVYLSQGSINAEIVSAKSSEMNILVPGPDGEFKEFAVPEQFKTQYNGKKLVTEVTDINA